MNSKVNETAFVESIRSTENEKPEDEFVEALFVPFPEADYDGEIEVIFRLIRSGQPVQGAETLWRDWGDVKIHHKEDQTNVNGEARCWVKSASVPPGAGAGFVFGGLNDNPLRTTLLRFRDKE